MQPFGEGSLVRRSPALRGVDRAGPVRSPHLVLGALVKWILSDPGISAAIPATRSVRHAGTEWARPASRPGSAPRSGPWWSAWPAADPGCGVPFGAWNAASGIGGVFLSIAQLRRHSPGGIRSTWASTPSPMRTTRSGGRRPGRRLVALPVRHRLLRPARAVLDDQLPRPPISTRCWRSCAQPVPRSMTAVQEMEGIGTLRMGYDAEGNRFELWEPARRR